MPFWVLVIVLVSVVGGLILEYQKNKMNMEDRSQQNEEEVEDVRKLVNSLKTRIENLEAIAAGEPEEFKTGAGAGMSEIEIEETDTKEENKQHVSDIANKQRT
jgi:uncharacterized protein YlxW (UPF0749 family)